MPDRGRIGSDRVSRSTDAVTVPSRLVAGLIMKSVDGARAVGNIALIASSRKSRPACRRERKSLPTPSTPPARFTREATKFCGFESSSSPATRKNSLPSL
jgi:hypothetical protein